MPTIDTTPLTAEEQDFAAKLDAFQQKVIAQAQGLAPVVALTPPTPPAGYGRSLLVQRLFFGKVVGVPKVAVWAAGLAAIVFVVRRRMKKTARRGRR